MTGPTKRDRAAERRARNQAERAGTEIAAARLEHGMSLRRASRRAGISIDTLQRIEAGHPGASVLTLCAAGHAVGLDIVVSAYRGRGPSLRDTGQLRIAQILGGIAHSSWQTRLEVTAGDNGEAADMGLFGPVEIMDAEIDRIVGDFQDRHRRNSRKRDWIAAHNQRPVRLVMVVEDTKVNRLALAPHEELIRSVLPADSRAVLRAIRTGTPLGSDGLLWIRPRDPPRA